MLKLINFLNLHKIYEYVQINIDVQSNSVIDNILNAHKNSGVILLFKLGLSKRMLVKQQKN